MTSYDAVLNVNRVVAHPSQHDGLVQGTDDKYGIVPL